MMLLRSNPIMTASGDGITKIFRSWAFQALHFLNAISVLPADLRKAHIFKESGSLDSVRA
ncbi:MAG TPA: hypothetical protein DDW24_05210 [Blastocatellia bacterium]|nr:hypothetical protein [Blastocatellia bacterium]